MATAAKARVKLKPGFAEGAGSFEVAEYQLNQDHWTEGYKIVCHALTVEKSP